jgi:ribosomal protein L17
LQFDIRASLHDKLTASKRARTTLKKCRHLRDLLEQTITEIDK